MQALDGRRGKLHVRIIEARNLTFGSSLQIFHTLVCQIPLPPSKLVFAEFCALRHAMHRRCVCEQAAHPVLGATKPTLHDIILATPRATTSGMRPLCVFAQAGLPCCS